MRRRLTALSALGATTALLLSGCSSPVGHDAGHLTPYAASGFPNWPTYHLTNQRAGHASRAVVPPLHRAWKKALRGSVYGEPLMVGGSLIVATERNYLYGLNPSTGAVRWRRHLGTAQPLSGLPCGNIDPLGITGTPAYDKATGSVFVVAETKGGHHTLWAIRATTGRTRWHRSLDVLPNRNRKAEQQRSALLVEHGRVITTFGGLAGDCANYVGYATSVPVGGRGRTYHYAVPTAREAGMWSPAGPVVGRNGHVYVASGNGAQLNGRWDRSDSVTELSPVKLVRLSVFAPATWRNDNVRDLDLGSSSPVTVGTRIVIAGKRGTVYLLRPSLGGVGSAVTNLTGCTAFGGAARVDARTLLMPCKGNDSIRQLKVAASSMHWGWTASNLSGSPVVAGGYAYVADADSGDLVVLRLGNGSVAGRAAAGSLTHFPSATISGPMIFVPTLTGVTAFTGS
ncbi:MAG: PQQ-binding-like beta-propeller repeat protein [Nocardioidaceae bacterium]